jgi:hypothetical protein
MRAFRGYGNITQYQPRGWFTSHTLQLSVNRRFRDGLAFGFNDTILLKSTGSTAARIEHLPDGSFRERADQAQADELLGDYIPNRHTLKGNFVWDLPDVQGSGSAMRVVRYLANDWQLSGVWTAQTGGAYTVGMSYQSGGSQNITGSPSYGGRVRILGDPGAGCSSDPYRQLNTAAFAGPEIGSVGLESGSDYLRGCFTSVLDLALARNIRLGGTRNLQFRLDVFNAPNQAIILNRNTTMQLASPVDGRQMNLPFDASGNLIASRSLPKNAGFGVPSGSNAYQSPRTMQMQIRFSF